MCGLEDNNKVKLTRKYLKLKILNDTVNFSGHKQEREHVYDMISRTIVQGESQSAIIIGPRGCGKTTLLNSVLNQLSEEVDLENDAIIVKLNGLVHSDEKTSLKSITAQMQLENAVGDKVFGTFAENLAFLLNCLQSGVDRRCKSMVFLLEEFDMFCKSQTLLYNLFDITHAKQSPMCVIGTTNRLDVIELLEKRVKSRFSHRHIYLFPNEKGIADNHTASFMELLVQLLSMPSVASGTKKKSKKRKSCVAEEVMDIDTPNYALPDAVLTRCNVDRQEFSQLTQSYIEDWNAHIKSLVDDEKVIDVIEKFCYFTVNEQIFRNVLFEVVSKLSLRKPVIDPRDLISVIDRTVAPEHRVKLLQSLSILELSLVIAMKHGIEIFDGQPMNFEMVLHRYTKFANANSSTQTVPRSVILKAFEHLQALEVIMPIRSTDSIYTASENTASRVQKEYQLFTLAIPVEDINEAVNTFKALPTEISHWYNNMLD